MLKMMMMSIDQYMNMLHCLPKITMRKGGVIRARGMTSCSNPTDNWFTAKYRGHTIASVNVAGFKMFHMCDSQKAAFFRTVRSRYASRSSQKAYTFRAGKMEYDASTERQNRSTWSFTVPEKRMLDVTTWVFIYTRQAQSRL